MRKVAREKKEAFCDSFSFLCSISFLFLFSSFPSFLSRPFISISFLLSLSQFRFSFVFSSYLFPFLFSSFLPFYPFSSTLLFFSPFFITNSCRFSSFLFSSYLLSVIALYQIHSHGILSTERQKGIDLSSSCMLSLPLCFCCYLSFMFLSFPLCFFPFLLSFLSFIFFPFLSLIFLVVVVDFFPFLYFPSLLSFVTFL